MSDLLKLTIHKLPQDRRNYASFILVWCAIISSNLSHAKRIIWSMFTK